MTFVLRSLRTRSVLIRLLAKRAEQLSKKIRKRTKLRLKALKSRERISHSVRRSLSPKSDHHERRKIINERQRKKRPLVNRVRRKKLLNKVIRARTLRRKMKSLKSPPQLLYTKRKLMKVETQKNPHRKNKRIELKAKKQKENQKELKRKGKGKNVSETKIDRLCKFIDLEQNDLLRSR